jgi:hypothetical protein
MSSSRKPRSHTLSEDNRNPDPMYFHPSSQNSDVQTQRFFKSKSEELRRSLQATPQGVTESPTPTKK